MSTTKAATNPLAFFLATICLCFASACKSPIAQSAGGPAAMVIPVAVATASLQSVPVQVQVVGIVEPSEKVEIKSMVAGEIITVRFAEGRDVKRGDLLMEIDARPYREALRQAEAAVVRDRSMLNQAQATLQKDIVTSKASDAEAARSDALLKDHLISQQQHLQTSSAAESAREGIRADRAAAESSSASLNFDLVAVDKAKLDLSYCEIRSPISGRAGNLLVHQGNLVKSNDVPLVVVNRIAPVFVSFNAPDKYLDAIRKYSATRKLPVDAISHEDTHEHESGTLSVIDNTVDTQTGTIHLKASFANTRRILWPGQFVDVVLTLSSGQDATVIPGEAVQAGQQGQFVYVVKNDKTVAPRPISVGRTVENKVIVDQGLAAGETVVTDGQMMLFPGAHVAVAASPKGPSGVL